MVLVMVMRRGAGGRLVGLLREGGVVCRGVERGARIAHGGVRVCPGCADDRDEWGSTQDDTGDQPAKGTGGGLVRGHETIVDRRIPTR